MLVGISSCSEKSRETVVVTEGARDNMVEVKDALVSIDSLLPDMHSMTLLYMAGDTLLFQDFKATDYQFAAFDIPNEKALGRFGKFGNGPGEIANVGAVFYDNNSKTLYGANGNRGKIVGFYVPEALNNPDYDAFDKIDMNEPLFDPSFVDETTVLCPMLASLDDKHPVITHIGRLNLSDGKITVIDSITDDKARFLISASPKKGLIFAGDMKQDVISIFNLDGKLLRRIIGPEYSEEVNKQDRYFSSSVFIDDVVAVVYSGKNSEIPQNKVIITDLDGNYIKTLKFDFSIYSMVYHPSTGRVYVSTSGDPQFGYIDSKLFK